VLRVSTDGQFFDLNDAPKPMSKIANFGDVYVTFKPAV
jgi:hypothetical protein